MKTKNSTLSSKENRPEHQTAQTCSDFASRPKTPLSLIRHSKANNTLNLTKSQVQPRYKCGCSDHSLIPRLSYSISGKSASKTLCKPGNAKFMPTYPSTIMIHDGVKLRSDSRQARRYKMNKVQSNKSLKGILQKIDKLQIQYKQLSKESQARGGQLIEYVPREVIRSVDKIVRVDRLVQKKIVNIKKIPREVVHYREVPLQVPVQKEQLVFIDSEDTPESVTKEVVVVSLKTVEEKVDNKENEKLRESLKRLGEKASDITSKVTESSDEIRNLSQMVAEKTRQVQSLDQAQAVSSVKVLQDKSQKEIDNPSNATTDTNPSIPFNLSKSSKQLLEMSILRNGGELRTDGKSIFDSQRIEEAWKTPAPQQLVLVSTGVKVKCARIK